MTEAMMMWLLGVATGAAQGLFDAADDETKARFRRQLDEVWAHTRVMRFVDAKPGLTVEEADTAVTELFDSGHGYEEVDCDKVVLDGRYTLPELRALAAILEKTEGYQ